MKSIDAVFRNNRVEPLLCWPATPAPVWEILNLPLKGLRTEAVGLGVGVRRLTKNMMSAGQRRFMRASSGRSVLPKMNELIYYLIIFSNSEYALLF